MSYDVLGVFPTVGQTVEDACVVYEDQDQREPTTMEWQYMKAAALAAAQIMADEEEFTAPDVDDLRTVVPVFCARYGFLITADHVTLRVTWSEDHPWSSIGKAFSEVTAALPGLRWYDPQHQMEIPDGVALDKEKAAQFLEDNWTAS